MERLNNFKVRGGGQGRFDVGLCVVLLVVDIGAMLST
jgi:hypothetical protein